MSEVLPLDNFKWMTDEECENFDVNWINDDDDGTGYILEVDLDYSPELHESHRHFPLAAEKMTVNEQILSPLSKNTLVNMKGNERKKAQDENYLPSHKSPKLSATFQNRKKYVLHSLNLKYYIQKGLKLRKVHRGISFRQQRFIKPFVEMCAKQRQSASTEQMSQIWVRYSY